MYSHGNPDHDPVPDELGGNVTYIPVRNFEFKVPHKLELTDKAFDEPIAEVNQLGPLFAVEVPLATATDYDSFMAAFNKRCNFDADDDIDTDAFNKAMDFIATMDGYFSGDQWDENEDDRNRWLSKFGDSKRNRMTTAYSEFYEFDYKYLGTKDLSVKQEILLKRNDPTWAPRIIYAGNDTYNAVSGPAAMVAMERLMALLHERSVCGIVTKFAYKTTDVDLVEHLTRDGYRHVAEGDYSRNDREQRKRVHILFDRFLECIGMPQWYRELERQVSRFKVQSIKFGFTAWLRWQLPTGVTVTTVRNSFYNWLMFTMAMARQGIRARCVILGDDLLATTNIPVNLNSWVSFVNLFKMVLKAKSPRLHAMSTFLSRRLCIDTAVGCMFPLVGKALLRFNARGTRNAAVSDSQYMAGKALSYAYEFRHVPCMRDSFLRRFLMEDVEKVTTDELTWFAKTSNLTIHEIMDAIKHEPNTLTEEEFELCILEAYDLDLDSLKEMLHSVIENKEPTMYCHPYDHCLLVDV